MTWLTIKRHLISNRYQSNSCNASDSFTTPSVSSNRLPSCALYRRLPSAPRKSGHSHELRQVAPSPQRFHVHSCNSQPAVVLFLSQGTLGSVWLVVTMCVCVCVHAVCVHVCRVHAHAVCHVCVSCACVMCATCLVSMCVPCCVCMCVVCECM